jgi:hypothetical protein
MLESETRIKNEIIHKKQIGEDIENEIECPRCYDIMTLCSDFNNLYYLCDSCDFCLYTIKR